MSAFERWCRVCAGAAVIAAVSLSGHGAGARESFVLAHAVEVDHIVQPVVERFRASLQQLSGGELSVDYRQSGEVGDCVELFERTVRGELPMTLGRLVTNFDEGPDIGYLPYLAYVVDDWPGAERLYGPGGAMVDLLDGVLREQNLRLLGAVPGGFGSIAVRKGADVLPTSFPEEAEGFRMRVPPFEIAVRRYEAWGFLPVRLPYDELYAALEQGSVDGRSFGLPQEIWDMRDTLSAYVLTRDYFDLAFWMVNEDWWNSLDDVQRDWIAQAAEDALAFGWDESRRRAREQLDRIAAYGIEVVELTPEQFAKAKAIVYAVEWPWMEDVVGEGLMDRVRDLAGIATGHVD